MRPSVITFTIFNLLLLSGCRTDSSATKEFKLYLHSVFDMEPVNGKVYLLVTDNVCKACVSLNGKNLSSRLNSNLYIISPLPKTHFSNFENYLNDVRDEMDGLKLLDYESKLVVYEGDEVQVIHPVEVVPKRSAPPLYCPRN